MLYRLLRNNKEAGPYTKEQLQEKGLKPYDLIWVEGRGAAWLYASEIPELKSFAPVVEEQPFDRFYKRKDNTTVTATGTAKKVKPRFRISGDKIIMIEGSDVQPAATPVKEEFKTTVIARPETKKPAQPGVGPDWEDMYKEWKHEIKEEVVYEAYDTHSEQQKVNERFDNLKKQHTDKTVPATSSKKQPLSTTNKQNMMTCIALVVLALGGFAGYYLNKQGKIKTTAAQQTTQPIERAEIASDNTLLSQQQNDADNGNVTVTDDERNNPLNSENNKAVNEQPKRNIENDADLNTAITVEKEPKTLTQKKAAADDNIAVNKQLLAKTSDVVATTKKSVLPANTNAKSAAVTDKRQVENNTSKNIKVPAEKLQSAGIPPANTSAKTTDSIVPTNNPAPPKRTIPEHKKIQDYVSVHKAGSGANTNVQNVHLTVENVADFPIDLAVIDIQYFDANGRFQKGETMYIKNLAAGNNVDVRVPDNRNSRSINYKVSLVSAEQKTLYLVAD